MSDLYHDETDLSKQIYAKLPDNRHWDYEDFRSSMIILSTLSALENPRYIPYNRLPDSIHLEGLKPAITQLKELTANTGDEHSRAVLGDIEKQKFVLSRKISRGNNYHTYLEWVKEPGRELLQTRVLSIHTHPTGMDGWSMGFSDMDYKTFMKDPQQAGMIITVGEGIYMVLKTSSTPTKLEGKDIDRRIVDEGTLKDEALKKEMAERPGSNKFGLGIKHFVEFNKNVCRNLGLAFYKAGPENRVLLERISLA